MAQDTIDKIINIQFRYSDLIKGGRPPRQLLTQQKPNCKSSRKQEIPRVLPSKRRLSKRCVPRCRPIPERFKPISAKRLN